MNHRVRLACRRSGHVALFPRRAIELPGISHRLAAPCRSAERHQAISARVVCESRLSDGHFRQPLQRLPLIPAQGAKITDAAPPDVSAEGNDPLPPLVVRQADAGHPVA
jgi:hypothetical protein